MTTPHTLIDGVDEFDIDLTVLDVETTALPRAWTGDAPPMSDPGSTCHFSCQETCGGTCTCPGVCFGD